MKNDIITNNIPGNCNAAPTTTAIPVLLVAAAFTITPTNCVSADPCGGTSLYLRGTMTHLCVSDHDDDDDDDHDDDGTVGHQQWVALIIHHITYHISHPHVSTVHCRQ